MPRSSDEFGDSLEEMFPNLKEDSVNSFPELEDMTGFASGSTFKSVQPKAKDTHLTALFIQSECAQCRALSLSFQNYAVRKVYPSRNECIEFERIGADCLHLFDHLPRLFHFVRNSTASCPHCAVAQGFVILPL